MNFVVLDAAAAATDVAAWGAEQDSAVRLDRTDGLSMMSRSDSNRFWSVSLRASNTEPLLRLNVEAHDHLTMTHVVTALTAILGRHGATSGG